MTKTAPATAAAGAFALGAGAASAGDVIDEDAVDYRRAVSATALRQAIARASGDNLVDPREACNGSVAGIGSIEVRDNPVVPIRDRQPTVAQ